MGKLSEALLRIEQLEREKEDLRLRWQMAESNMEIWRPRYHAAQRPTLVPKNTVFCGDTIPTTQGRQRILF